MGLENAALVLQSDLNNTLSIQSPSTVFVYYFLQKLLYTIVSFVEYTENGI